MGEVADADILPSAIGLVWRALLVWLVVLLLLTLAYWAPGWKPGDQLAAPTPRSGCGARFRRATAAAARRARA